jgi:mono/diheme cytochrome c family protein
MASWNPKVVGDRRGVSRKPSPEPPRCDKVIATNWCRPPRLCDARFHPPPCPPSSRRGCPWCLASRRTVFPTTRALLMQPVAFLAVSFCLALGPDAAAGPVDYARDVKPLLAKHCVSCHGARLTRGKLKLDTAASALKGGQSGASIVPGKADESPLIDALTSDDPTERMPLKRPPLADSEIAILRSWTRGPRPRPVRRPRRPSRHTGPSSRPGESTRPRFPSRRGLSIRSTPSCTHGSKKRGFRHRPRPTASR